MKGFGARRTSTAAHLPLPCLCPFDQKQRASSRSCKRRAASHMPHGTLHWTSLHAALHCMHAAMDPMHACLSPRATHAGRPCGSPMGLYSRVGARHRATEGQPARPSSHLITPLPFISFIPEYYFLTASFVRCSSLTGQSPSCQGQGHSRAQPLRPPKQLIRQRLLDSVCPVWLAL